MGWGRGRRAGLVHRLQREGGKSGCPREECGGGSEGPNTWLWAETPVLGGWGPKRVRGRASLAEQQLQTIKFILMFSSNFHKSRGWCRCHA